MGDRLLSIPYCPHDPWSNPKQVRFLLDFRLEVLYGGAAGGGKSDALLMAALQFATIPGYAAIIFRKSYTDLKLPGALIDRSMSWLTAYPQLRWDRETHTWHFPSGASLSFGYLESANDQYRYQSAEFQFIGFDEVTQFTEAQYRFMFSRLRRPGNLASSNPLSNIPLRMRAATNPIGAGKEWVKRRFIGDGQSPIARNGGSIEPGRSFIPATVWDNRHLDRDEYIAALNRMHPVVRMQMLNGDWDAWEGGRFFSREWWGWWGKGGLQKLHTQQQGIISPIPTPATRASSPAFPGITSLVRYWDLAASERKDADFTAGVLMGRADGTVGHATTASGEEMALPKGAYVIADVIRGRWSSQKVEQMVRATAARDGKAVQIYIEQDPAQAGKSQINYYRRHVLDGYTFRGHRFPGDKLVRAGPLASQAEGGNVYLLQGAAWVDEFLDEFDAFPDGEHDDQVDATSGAFDVLSSGAQDNVVALPVSIGQSSYWKW